jgi:dihydrodipicolinate synthase/N-acetylneuraminate lyase
MPSNETSSLAPNPPQPTPTQKTGPALQGIHVPSLTFFTPTPNQEIDWPTQKLHLTHLITSKIHGVVLAGTNGEAATLTRAEKTLLVRATKEIALEKSRPDLKICLGTSGACTRDVLDDCNAAGEAGADFVLVLVPSFFHFAMSKTAVCEFFEEVADQSPVPVVVYNFPGVAAGLDVDSDMLGRLAKHEKIVGVKVRTYGCDVVLSVSVSVSSSTLAEISGFC